MRDTAFIVTKPLQILVALAIIKQLDIRDKTHLVIVDNFFNARLVYERMKSADWEFSDLAIEFYTSHREAHQFVIESRVNNLFIDSDVGARKYFDLLRLKFKHRSLKINVYEEGVGTYRADLYSGIKKLTLELAGAGTQFGGCSLTSCLYLYNPEDYQTKFPDYAKKLKKICFSPTDIIRLYFSNLSYIFNYHPFSKTASDTCYVYLSSWRIDKEFLRKFFTFPGDKYLKLHPAIKYTLDTTLNSDAILVDNHIPAELLAINLEEKYQKIIFFHDGSSASIYISSNKISFMSCSDVCYLDLSES